MKHIFNNNVIPIFDPQFSTTVSTGWLCSTYSLNGQRMGCSQLGIEIKLGIKVQRRFALMGRTGTIRFMGIVMNPLFSEFHHHWGVAHGADSIWPLCRFQGSIVRDIA
jgi:hypothetical protein